MNSVHQPALTATAAPLGRCGLACPACGSTELTHLERELVCGACHNHYPLVRMAGQLVPWLYPDPSSSAAEWQARVNGFVDQQSQVQQQLHQALQRPGLLSSTRARLSDTLCAVRAHTKEIIELIQPFDFLQSAQRQQAGQLPHQQRLTGYINNVFRDWSWPTHELTNLTKPLLELLQQTKQTDLGHLLCVGGGAGGIPYELCGNTRYQSLTLLDLNPLLTHIAAQMFAGQQLQLTEFPVAPLDRGHTAVTQACRAPAPLTKAEFVVGDLMAAPFTPNSFDSLLTPWLVDILPHDLRTVLPYINQLLDIGGIWLNTGTLAFTQAHPAASYSPEELRLLLEDAGFCVLGERFDEVSYLRSPHSAHARRERLLSFCVRKVAHCSPPQSNSYAPKWLQQTSLPVTRSKQIMHGATDFLLRAQVLSAVDGTRSIDDISRHLAQHYQLDHAQAKRVVTDVLTRAARRDDGFNV